MARPARTKKATKKKVEKRKTSKKVAKRTSKKRAGKKVPARRRRPDTEVLVGVATDAESLTARILELDRDGKRALVHSVAEIGQLMLELQQVLGFGMWLPWLRQRLPYPPRTAQRYIAIGRFAQTFPQDFEAFAHLGLLKLVLLAQLTEQERARLRNAGPIAIPGQRHRKPLEAMTVEEAAAALLPAGGPALAQRPATVPIDSVVRRFRHRVAGLDALADILRDRADELPRRTLSALHRDLLSVVEELETTLAE